MCKGRLCSSCQVQGPRALEGHILVYRRPPAVLLNLETQIHEGDIMALRPHEVNGTFQDLPREISEAMLADVITLCE